MIIACPTLTKQKNWAVPWEPFLVTVMWSFLTGTSVPARRPLLRKLQKHWAWTDGTYQVPRFSHECLSGEELTLQHFDLYRLTSSEELDDIGFYEYVGAPGVTFIEWAELFPCEMPEDHLSITLRQEGAGRVAELVPHGAHYEALVRKVEELC